MSIVEKLIIPQETQKGAYFNDVWNSLYNPDIIKSIDEDNLTVKAIIMLLETAISSVKSVGKELKEVECQKESLRKGLETIGFENENLKQQIDQQLNCRQCPELQKKLNEQIKRTKDCKRSIQSIYALLKPTLTDNNVEDTQKALVETQTIMGKYFEEDSDIIPETPCLTAKPVIKNAIRNKQQKYQNELKPVSHEEERNNGSNESLTPHKENGRKTSEDKSPILKSAKRTIKFKVSQENTSPVKSQKRTAPPNRSQGQTGNSSKLEWKLRADDSAHSSKQSSLKQATLSVKARPRLDVKRDLSMMDGFSGGALPRCSSNAADQGRDRRHSEADSDDYIAKSPGIEANCHSSLSLAKKRPRSSKEEGEEEDLSEDQMPVIMTLDETHFAPMAASTCNIDYDEEKKKKQKRNNSNNPRNQLKIDLPKPPNDVPTTNSKRDQPSTSSGFKYQRDAVKKKSERLKLDGWSCDDCEKFYKKMEERGMNASLIKKTMNRCSRHRNKFQKPSTPPDYWNPKMDTSDEDDD